jgi:hypothetical protein
MILGSLVSKERLAYLNDVVQVVVDVHLDSRQVLGLHVRNLFSIRELDVHDVVVRGGENVYHLNLVKVSLLDLVVVGCGGRSCDY